VIALDVDLIPAEIIEKKIYMIRGHKVMLDKDLAELYGVETKRLNEQVRRNPKRFPNDFMFQLTEEETESLRSHFATLKRAAGENIENICPMLLPSRALKCSLQQKDFKSTIMLYTLSVLH